MPSAASPTAHRLTAEITAKETNLSETNLRIPRDYHREISRRPGANLHRRRGAAFRRPSPLGTDVDVAAVNLGSLRDARIGSFPAWMACEAAPRDRVDSQPGRREISRWLRPRGNTKVVRKDLFLWRAPAFLAVRPVASVMTARAFPSRRFLGEDVDLDEGKTAH